jgi:hypothetical protein
MGHNIKVCVKKITLEGVDWIDLAHYRDKWWALVRVVTKIKASQN